MTRRVFFSFYYDDDSQRVQQIKNMGVIEHQRIMNSNEWEEVKRKGSNSIKNWINNSMRNTSCTVVLIGTNTYKREWVKYEIKHSIEIGKPIFGIRIHNILNLKGEKSAAGLDPFKELGYTNIDTYDTTYYDAYGYIKDNFNKWVEKAINN